MLGRENTELRRQLLVAPDIPIVAATDAGRPHDRIAAILVERDAWRIEVGRLQPYNVCELSGGNSESSRSKSLAFRERPM